MNFATQVANVNSYVYINKWNAFNIINAGNSIMYVDNNIVLQPGASYGISLNTGDFSDQEVKLQFDGNSGTAYISWILLA